MGATTGLAHVALPAACGELVQGTLDGVRCLVSCPIDRYSIAQVTLQPEPGWEAPADSPKAVSALRAGLAHLGQWEVGGKLRLISDLPRGRGYGSSTADVGATLYALGQALCQAFSPLEVAQLALQVEPSDSTIFPGLAVFDHREGSFHEPLGPAPPLAVILLDPGGKVDTIAFNRLDHRPALRRLAPQHGEAFALLRTGLKRSCWQDVGQAATLSARAHQVILFNPLLEPALKLARDVSALGVCRAHSGTLIGLLLDPARADVAAAMDWVQRQVDVRVANYPLVAGGPRYNVDETTERLIAG